MDNFLSMEVKSNTSRRKTIKLTQLYFNQKKPQKYNGRAGVAKFPFLKKFVSNHIQQTHIKLVLRFLPLVLEAIFRGG